MATEFIMPKLGLTMEAGTIREWLVDEDADVAAGTAVLVIETDKVETEVEASGSGRLHQTGVVGESYDCGVTIGWFLAEGEEPPAVVTPVVAEPAPTAVAAAPVAVAPVEPSPTGRLLASPNARRVAAGMAVDLAGVTGTGPGGRIVSEDVEAAAARPQPAAAAAAGVSSAPATAAARQLADLLGVDLAAVASTDGRRTREDVARHVRQLLAADVAAEATAPPAAPLTQSPSSTVPLQGMRGTIAGRMHESLHEMAQLTLTMDVDMDTVVADRDGRRRADETPLPGYTDYVIAAAAAALVEHPVVNSQVTDDGVALLPEVHVGMAVALDDGLMVPVVRDTPGWSLGDLAAETSRLADAVRNRTLSLSDLEGGTFSVTALGMYGVDAFTPIINPPNSAILGVGRLRRDAAVDDNGGLVAVTRLTLSLTWDHRAFDGAPAALFVRSIKQHLEHDWE
ncbi:MAG: 2-oxo acid dehydrogenase subunit E2 [Acidimicrobiales bacterium]